MNDEGLARLVEAIKRQIDEDIYMLIEGDLPHEVVETEICKLKQEKEIYKTYEPERL